MEFVTYKKYNEQERVESLTKILKEQGTKEGLPRGENSASRLL